jgi:uncharacterized membrane protein YtjA (UPF0391 family)
MVTAKAGV